MSKVKHLLRKFHIGGGGGGSGSGALNDHHPHHRRFGDDRSETMPLQQQASTSTEQTSASSSSTVPPLESSENANNANATAIASDFGLLEEEFQVQLALAISVSDRDSREDPETAQIKAAKQISLGCPPSQSLVDFISLKYWTYNVVNYDEKVMDGFYDVHGLSSNLMAQEKMPMLVDLQSISLGENVNYQVFLVNSAIDTDLMKLVEKVQLMPLEYSSLEVAPAMTDLVQKIAGIVVDRMGGPVDDAEEMVKKWRSRSYELRMSFNSVILPLGCLDIGLSRHRALLFKVLADQINLPCKLVKGSYYTGADDGAVDLIKFSDGSEYMIDLMGAPGALIPSEIPSFHHDITDISSHGDAAYQEFGSATGSGAAKINPEPSFASSELKEQHGDIFGDSQMELISRDFGKIALLKIWEGQLKSELERPAAQHIQAETVSDGVANVSGNPEITSEGSRILNFPDMPGQAQQLEGRVMVDSHGFPLMNLSKNDQAIIPFTGMHLFGNVPCCIDGNMSSKLLAEQKDVQRSFFNPRENFSSDAAGPRNDLLDSRADPMINTGNLLENFKETGLNAQSNCQNVHNEQVGALLGDVAEWEIPWEDLQIGERIGIGSYGEVHRAEWNGTEVAVKKFMNQDISGDALVQFRCEIEIMLRLRHPNLVLFMGAVTRPPNLSILTEYLPRGSLFKLLHRSNGQIDEKRRLRMAIDVAKGMNYLHTSHPTIVHRDLKSPNLLVDKNWVVKVCDFGMSRLKHHTFLSSKSMAGTAEWMAPEVLRNEPCNEKSDVYSFGVILWELATLEVPWMGMNSMQVVGAVGFQGWHLKIPDCIDPMVADLITDCWNSNALGRPSFAQILTRLKCLQHLTLTKEDIPINQP